MFPIQAELRTYQDKKTLRQPVLILAFIMNGEDEIQAVISNPVYDGGEIHTADLHELRVTQDLGEP